MLRSEKGLSSPGEESHCLASNNAFFVGISAANPGQREPQGIKVKAEKANFGVIKRYHCSFFSVARPQLTRSIRAQGPVGNGLALAWLDFQSQLGGGLRQKLDGD